MIDQTWARNTTTFAIEIINGMIIYDLIREVEVRSSRYGRNKKLLRQIIMQRQKMTHQMTGKENNKNEND
jgi:hypothetical protein